MVSAGRDIRIAVPGLADSIARLAEAGDGLRLPAAEWLLARGTPALVAPADWRDWLLAGAGLGSDVLSRFPAGPCSVPGEFADGGALTWARAEPVHLLTAIDHLQLAAPVPLPLDAAESETLLGTLDAHLAGTGFDLRALPDGGWLCRCPDGLECTTVPPEDALGRNLRDALPTGRDAVRMRSLLNELQMLLHEHPVNERRAAQGFPPVNSVWLWGIGAAHDAAVHVSGDLLTDDAWLAGLWRRHSGRVQPVTALAQALAEPDSNLRVATMAAIDGRPAGDVLRALEAEVFAPLRAALVASRVRRVSLHTGRKVVELTPAARWAFWRRPRPLAEVAA